jgi:hypothetical protein
MWTHIQRQMVFNTHHEAIFFILNLVTIYEYTSKKMIHVRWKLTPNIEMVTKTIFLHVLKAVTKWKIVIWHIWSKSKGWQHVDERNIFIWMEFITWMNLNMVASQLRETKWPFWGSWQHGWWRVPHENSMTWINVLMDKIDHVVGHMDEFYSSMRMNLCGWIT